MTVEPLLLPSPGDLQAEEAVAVIRERGDIEPKVAVVLGSGQDGAARGIESATEISFEGLPGFPHPSVPGHPGRLRLGTLSGVPVIAFLGRIHFYEGATLPQCALPVRVARLLGATTLLLTASTGPLDPGLAVGDLVIATDHINLMGKNPLLGWRRPDGTPPFVDMNDVYDPALARLAEDEAHDLGLPVTRGVYLAVSGPSYETPAEMEFMRRAGGTVVGMSVVPEAVPARALGMRVLALLTVTNTLGDKVSHREVVEAAEKVAGSIGALIERVILRIDQEGAGA